MAQNKTQLVAAAAAKHNVQPDALLSFKVYPDKVAIVLPSGQKYTYSYSDLLGFFSQEPTETPDQPQKPSRKPANTRK